MDVKRQPSLFNFKPTEALRRSGLTPQEERELIIFCLDGDDRYPRKFIVERTGTEYEIKSEYGAALLYRAIRKSGNNRIPASAFDRDTYDEARKRNGSYWNKRRGGY